MTASNSIKYCANSNALSSLNPGELAYDASTGSIYVGDSTSSGNICIGNSNYNTYTTATATYPYNIIDKMSSDSSWYRPDYDMRELLLCLKEDELLDVVRKAKDRLDERQFKKQLKMIVYEYHFSEDFLLEFIDFLDKDIVLHQHRRDITSGEYESLKCLYELQ
jgi:hypothetical protein